MALRDWLGFKREAPPVSPAPAEVAPLSSPPAGPPAPGVPLGAPTTLPLSPPGAPPQVPPPFTPPAPITRVGHDVQSVVTPAPPLPADPPPAASGGWLSRLRAGLSRSTAKLTESVTSLFAKRRLDETALEELEETLIAADLGLPAAQRVVEGFRRTRFGREVTDAEVKAALAEEIAAILNPVARPLAIAPDRAPHVVLVVGVNGTGKTTTIAKLAAEQRGLGLSVELVAGDTFRAAAVEQLQIWGERTGCRVHVPAKDGADPAGLAYEALAAARKAGTELLLIDTAGRLHNKTALMEELRKIVRVIQRVDPTAPHSVLLTLDATTGQNALQQVKVFRDMVAVTGLVVTKLDGSAKGGVVVALAQEFGLPVHAVGVGERAGDLRPFDAREFAQALVGVA